MVSQKPSEEEEQEMIGALIREFPALGARLLTTFGLAHPLVNRYCRTVLRMGSPDSAPHLAEIRGLWEEGMAALAASDSRPSVN